MEAAETASASRRSTASGPIMVVSMPAQRRKQLYDCQTRMSRSCVCLTCLPTPSMGLPSCDATRHSVLRPNFAQDLDPATEFLYKPHTITFGAVGEP